MTFWTAVGAIAAIASALAAWSVAVRAPEKPSQPTILRETVWVAPTAPPQLAQARVDPPPARENQTEAAPVVPQYNQGAVRGIGSSIAQPRAPEPTKQDLEVRPRALEFPAEPVE